MRIIIIGTKVAETIMQYASKKVDNAEFQIFGTFTEFMNTTAMRRIDCDRLIITSETFATIQGGDVETVLQSVHEFIETQYPQVLTITLTREFADLKQCESVFYGDTCLNLCMTKVRPNVLRDLVALDRDGLVSTYKECLYEHMAAQQPAAEGVNIDAMFTQAQDITQPTTQQPDTTPKKEANKGGNIFTMFNGKGKKAGNKVDTSAFVEDFNTSGNGQMAPPPQQQRAKRLPSGFGGKQNTADMAANTNTGFTDAPQPVQQSVSGFDDPNSMSFDMPQASQAHGFSMPQSQTGFDMPTGNQGFDMPSSNQGFDTPPLAQGFDTPNANQGFDMPTGNQGFDTPQSSAFGAPQPSFQPTGTPPIASVSGRSPRPTQATRPQAQAPQLESASPLTMPGFSPDAFNAAATQQQQQAGNKLVPRDRGSNLTQAKSIAPMTPNVDFNTLAEQYREETAPVRTVVKEVVRNVPTGAANKFDSIVSGNSKGVLLFTGDRRAGATHTAITVAEHFSKHCPTLFIDCDLKRHGSLFYLGIEDVTESGAAVQNGLNLVQTGQNISQYVFRTTRFKFDSLVSMPGTTSSIDNLRTSMSRLIYEVSQYSALIFDCPIEQMAIFSDLLFSMSVFICVDSDLCGCNNILSTLDAFDDGLDNKAKMLLRGRSHYLVNQTEETNEFATNMAYLESLYALDQEEFNWARIPCAGVMTDVSAICNSLS